MSGMKVRHDFTAGEETIGGAKQHESHLTSARDEMQSLHRANMAGLGYDVAGSDNAAAIGQQQFQRDQTSIDSAGKMHASNQRSQDIQMQAAHQATRFFGNRR